MTFENEYDRREWLGREALKELKRKYPHLIKWELNFTTDKFYEFDSFYFVPDLETGSIKMRVWIEIKIRDDIYPEYILEKKKLQSLIRKRNNLLLKKDEVQFLYINFTPEGTIIWKIGDELLLKTQKLKANKATAQSRTYKVDKEVIYLDKKTGYRFNYIPDEKSLLDNHIEKIEKPQLNIKVDKLGDFLQSK